MVSSTYTWNDPQKRVLILDYFNGDTTTRSYIPAVIGVEAYTTYLAWAISNTAKPYVAPDMGFGTLAEAKATRIAKIRSEIASYINSNYEYEILRKNFHNTFTLSGEAHERIERLFVLSESLIAAVNAGTSLDDIRSAKIDFLNLTHSTIS